MTTLDRSPKKHPGRVSNPRPFIAYSIGELYKEGRLMLGFDLNPELAPCP